MFELINNHILNTPFKDIMTDSAYSQKRRKRFRILIYIARFGCIHLNDMAYIFPEDIEKKSNGFDKITKNWAAILNYLASDIKLLEKVGEGYYTLTKNGIKYLYEYLKEQFYIADIDFEYFQKNIKINKVHLSHSSKTGRMVLSFFRMLGTGFLVEPVFDFQGDLILPYSKQFTHGYLLPDAVMSDCENELYFLEADSSHESVSVDIMQKLVRYSSSVLKNAQKDTLFSVHFSIWNYRDKDTLYLGKKNDVNNIISLYEFISENLSLDCSFLKLTDSLISYTGSNDSLNALSKYLKNFDSNKICSSIELLELTDKYELIENFTKKYNARKNKILSIVPESKEFYEKLLDGCRLACTPLSSDNRLFDYIYLEQDRAFLNCKKWNDKIIPDYESLSFHRTYLFEDFRTGSRYTLRNVFKVTKNSKSFYVSFENISDEIGGYYRVKHYLDSTDIYTNSELKIVCLYNDFNKYNPLEFVVNSNEKHTTIIFLSYSDFSFC